MFGSYLEQASTYAADIDNTILLVFVLTTPFFLAAEVVFFWFIWKFRDKGDGRKAAYIDGTNPQHKRWVTWPHYAILVADVAIVWMAISVWVNVKQTLPEPDATVRVISQQWAWTFQHPGPDSKLDTDDDITISDELHIEMGKTYHYELYSKDVLHDFSVPVFRLKQDAVPGRMIKGWFKATKTGEYSIQCAEMCGIGHGLMPARLHIESAEDHQKWMASQAGAKS